MFVRLLLLKAKDRPQCRLKVYASRVFFFQLELQVTGLPRLHDNDEEDASRQACRFDQHIQFPVKHSSIDTARDFGALSEFCWPLCTCFDAARGLV